MQRRSFLCSLAVESLALSCLKPVIVGLWKLFDLVPNSQPSARLHLFEITYDRLDGPCVYAAENAAQAVAMARENEWLKAAQEPIEIEQIPDDAPYTYGDEHGTKCIRPAGEIANEDGPGFQFCDAHYC